MYNVVHVSQRACNTLTYAWCIGVNTHVLITIQKKITSLFKNILIESFDLRRDFDFI